MGPKRTLVGAAVLAGGVAGGIAVRQVLAGRHGDAEPPVPTPWPPGTIRRYLAMGDGARIHVAERGTGRPVLLLHGITLSAAIWTEQLRRLPDDGLRVVAVDLRGHGQSGAGGRGVALDRITADVVEVVDVLGLDDVVLVGHSMGGMVALRLLATRPDLAGGDGWLGGLVLAATSAAPALHRGVLGAGRLVGAAGPLLGLAGRLARLLPGGTLADSAASDPIAALTFAEHPDPGPVRLTRKVTAGVPIGVAADLLAQLVRFDEAAALGAIAVPTTVVVGDGDLITPPAHAADLARAIPGAELVTVEGAGHMLMLERPDELDAVIREAAARVRR